MIVKDMQEKEKALDVAEVAISNNKGPRQLDETTTESILRQWLSDIFDQAYLMGERSGLRIAKNIMANSNHRIEDILNKENPQ